MATFCERRLALDTVDKVRADPASLSVTFYGVRGSTPCAGRDTIGYGGNTSCVVVDSPGHTPIIFDLGTGLRSYGAERGLDGSFRGVALVSHLHWDHIQGLPFFRPVLAAGAELTVYGPPSEGGLSAAFDRFMCDPFFPVGVADLPGKVRFEEIERGSFQVDGAVVTAFPVPHRGLTNGYRLERDGLSVVYIPDHQQPIDSPFSTTPEVLEMCAGADLLIHDAQYTPEEFLQRSTWGHCTIEYACWLAEQSSAKRLALFHHDPSHDDEWLAKLIGAAEQWGLDTGIEVVGASEGTTIGL